MEDVDSLSGSRSAGVELWITSRSGPLGEASHRSFSSLFDCLAWPEKDLLQLLRNRSPFINVHTEDVSRFTNRIRVVYRRPAEGIPG